jgi:hypothetical protein
MCSHRAFPVLTLNRHWTPAQSFTARASFRSCSRFPICLHRQTGAGLSRLLSDGRNKGPPMRVDSLNLSDASCCQNKICP